MQRHTESNRASTNPDPESPKGFRSRSDRIGHRNCSVRYRSIRSEGLGVRASLPPRYPTPNTYRIQCSARVHACTLPSRESTTGVSGASNAVPIHRGPIPPSGPDFRGGAVFGQSLGATGATTSGTRTEQKEKKRKVRCKPGASFRRATGSERTPRGMIVIESTWRRGRAQWSPPHR